MCLPSYRICLSFMYSIFMTLGLPFRKIRFLVRFVLAQILVFILIATWSFVFQERPYGMRVLGGPGIDRVRPCLGWSMLFDR